MHMRPGLQVARLGKVGKGQVTHVEGARCEVQWSNHGREWVSADELIWVGLRIRNPDGYVGRVVSLGRQRVLVRVSDGSCHWMKADELIPRTKQGVAENGNS